MKVRSATLNEVELILPLVCEYHKLEEIEMNAADRESAVRKLLENPDFGGIWMIYVDEQLAGYIALCRGYSIEFNGFDAFLDEFFLNPEFRGKGVGTQVLEFIQSEARRLGINALHLEVARDNRLARKLYRQAGFEVREKYVLMSVELREQG